MNHEELSAQEAIDLEQAESAVERCAEVFDAGVRALAVIRDKRLYRERYRTFEQYCQERWGYTRQHVNRLISASHIVEVLLTEPIGSKPGDVEAPIPLPANESQTRAIAALPEEEQAPAWRQAVTTAPGGKVTAKHVEKVVAERKAPKAAPSAPPAVDDSKIVDMHSPALIRVRNISADLVGTTIRLANDIEHDTRFLAGGEQEISWSYAEEAASALEATAKALRSLRRAPAIAKS